MDHVILATGPSRTARTGPSSHSGSMALSARPGAIAAAPVRGPRHSWLFQVLGQSRLAAGSWNVRIQITTENPGGSGPRPVRASSAGIGSGHKAATAAPRDHAIKLACASGR